MIRQPPRRLAYAGGEIPRSGDQVRLMFDGKRYLGRVQKIDPPMLLLTLTHEFKPEPTEIRCTMEIRHRAQSCVFIVRDARRAHFSTESRRPR